MRTHSEVGFWSTNRMQRTSRPCPVCMPGVSGAGSPIRSGRPLMCRWVLIVLGVLIPMAARANPYILNPSSLIAFGVVAISALIVEAGIVALMLAFVGLAPLRMFGGFLFANVTVFLFIFWPLQQRVPLPLLEVVVMVIDAASIILLSKLAFFQGDSYRNVGWLFAGLASLAGNAASFCVGVMASGEPWKMHGVGE